MTSALEINGKKLYSISETVKLVSYSRDYVTRLAREKKISATHIGRQWFIDLDSLKNYEAVALFEQEVRNKHLSEERKQESVLRETIEKQNLRHTRKVKTFHTKSLVQASLVLVFGLFTGLALNQFTDFSQPFGSFQVALTTDSVSEPIRPPVSVDKTVVTTIDLSPKDLNGENLTAYFSKEINQFPVSDNGILLLPNAPVGDFASENIFSDEVMIRTLDKGEQVAVRIDSEGNQVGEEIPLVIIPVKAEENNL